MGGFFFFAGIGGLVGAALAGVAIWRELADPGRFATVAAVLGGVLLVTVAGIAFAMAPRRVEQNDFPVGRRGEFQVEAGFPSSRFDAIGGPGAHLDFELRAGGFLLSVPGQVRQFRREGDRAIVPAAFPIRQVRTWILAIMQGETQLDTITAGLEAGSGLLEADGILKETTPWTEWRPTDSGLAVRWRFAVLPQ